MSYRPSREELKVVSNRGGVAVLEVGTFQRHVNGDAVPHTVRIRIDAYKLGDIAYRAASSLRSEASSNYGAVVVVMERIGGGS